MTKKNKKLTTFEKIYLFILVSKTQFYNKLKDNYQERALNKQYKMEMRHKKIYNNIYKAYLNNRNKYYKFIAKLQNKVPNE